MAKASSAKAETETEDQPVVKRTHCPDCGEQLVPTPTDLRMCLCEANRSRTSVKAQAVMRVPDGWTLVELELPEAVVRQYAKRADGPHSADIASAKLEAWIARLATGA